MYNNKSKNHQNNKGRNFGNVRRQKPFRANAYQASSNNSNYRRLMNNDASSNQNKKSDDIPGSVQMLQYKANAESNISKWIKDFRPVLECLFGHLASFISTPNNQSHHQCRGQTQMIEEESSEQSKTKAQENMRSRSSDLKLTNPRCGGEIEKHMSIESKAQVKLDVDYNKLKESNDVLGLWRLIKQVHRTQAGKLNIADASLDALTNYYTMKQKESENIVQFKDRLLAVIQEVKNIEKTFRFN